MADHQPQSSPEPAHHNNHQPDPSPQMTHDDREKPHKEVSGYGYAAYGRRRETIGKAAAAILLLAAVTVLVLWLVYRPHQPKFRVVGAALQQLNATYSPTPSVSAAVQLTVVTRNPNRRVVLLYDQLSALVSYRGQPITPPAPLPPLRHGTKSTVALSPVLGGGGAVPAPPDLVGQILAAPDGGVAGLRLIIDGKIRYKADGPMFKRGWHGLRVRCDLVVARLMVGFVGQLPLLQSPPCAVDT
ncbi:Late embryogenesis abundant (LEA) hydroxyproline-rich glycoprotein family [Striga hermonthica]|uniref:Late embryogenesis abundant (LEA) hydroxyproline-rich glycoprotein family n=1 Tax=Striga hermonthica TaxID=68872 RepID=A0A9N7NIB4_STRHE|nr:Late embryogenesis abundant (LEA) hydroxyproline-rich glycoprotein family [Striga hermonthica]